MKVLKISLLLILLFSIVSCSQDDEPQEPTVDNPIARNGEWIPYESVKVYQDDTLIINEFINCNSFYTYSSLFFSTETNYFYKHNINQYFPENETCYNLLAHGYWKQIDENFNYQMILETFFDTNGNYITKETDTLNYHINFKSNDTIEIHHLDELETLQQQEPTLVDFYRLYSYDPFP